MTPRPKAACPVMSSASTCRSPQTTWLSTTRTATPAAISAYTRSRTTVNWTERWRESIRSRVLCSGPEIIETARVRCVSSYSKTLVILQVSCLCFSSSEAWLSMQPSNHTSDMSKESVSAERNEIFSCTRENKMVFVDVHFSCIECEKGGVAGRTQKLSMMKLLLCYIHS